MKKIIFLSALALLFSATSIAQNVGIGTTSPSAKLDISSTNSGILIPRVALTATNSALPLTSPATSTLVYNTATASSGATSVTPGYYYWSGSAWLDVPGGNVTGNNLVWRKFTFAPVTTDRIRVLVNAVAAGYPY